MITAPVHPTRKPHACAITIATLALLWLATHPTLAGAAKGPDYWTAKYDHHFRKYGKRYFGPYFDWHWFKSQAIAESGLNPHAQSRVGALGVMQIMPSTFEEIRDARPHFSDIDEPRWNIAAGIFYTRLLYDRWDHYPEDERLLLAFASYNAGFRRVQAAVNKTAPTNRRWEVISQKLPAETRLYVQRILRLMNKH